jgi:methylated-DNA-protein-cysteine methyltransferase related protein
MTRELPPFERVWALVRKIPRGHVVTYGQLSQLIDRRLSALGVGWAMRAAPASIPWHRVVNARGRVSTDDHEPGLQRALLESEGVHFDKGDAIDLERYRWRPQERARATRAGRSGRTDRRR